VSPVLSNRPRSLPARVVATQPQTAMSGGLRVHQDEPVRRRITACPQPGVPRFRPRVEAGEVVRECVLDALAESYPDLAAECFREQYARLRLP